MIEGGYIPFPRRVEDWPIYRATLITQRVYWHLVRNARHTDGGDFKRGELFTSEPYIMEHTWYYSGNCKKVFTKDQVFNALDWLRKKGLIVTAKTTRGLRVTICNYGYLFGAANYYTDAPPIPFPFGEQRREQQTNGIETQTGQGFERNNVSGEQRREQRQDDTIRNTVKELKNNSSGGCRGARLRQ
jgi:hypothetical protein